jgi:hypothetical protein
MGTVQNIMNDAELDQLENHAIDVAKRTHGALVEHYRPFLEGRVPPRQLERYLRGTLGGAFISIGLHELLESGMSFEDIIEKLEASRSDFEASRTSGGGEP